MKVLIIPSWYKNRDNPLAGTFFEEQARGLMSLGHDVTVFAPSFLPFSNKKPLENRDYDDEGLRTILFSTKAVIPRNRQFNYRYLCLKAYWRFKEYVEKHGKPDIIHAHSVFYGGIIANYISSKTGIPFVITEHLTNFLTGGVINRVDIHHSRTVFRNSFINIVVSSVFRDELSAKIEVPAIRFRVISNMVAPLFFRDRKPKKIVQGEPVRFFTNSFLTYRKNHKMLLDAFAIFLKDYPKAQLIIGGNITSPSELDCKNDIIEQYARLGLCDNVVMLGDLSRKEVKEELDKCHAFLLASKYETFGVVLIESLAAGKPIISTDSKGPRDIVTSHNGILVRSFEAADFAKSMKTLVQNYNQYDQDAISESCRALFGEKAIAGKLEEVYAEALAKK
ncbi:MAG TPA: glycosyltransferase [Bacteroidia bacterium]|jgi:glycosyltransferase involved in cell wall biosynthesis|nr:glycosyltransferase [Bacteroidia bacterium]